jgi:hypothetical protein
VAKTSVKHIRLELPSETHSKLKGKASFAGKKFKEWLVELLKEAANGK